MSDESTTDLRGRTVIVTGASAGIGAAAARQFAARGATVAVVGRSPEKVAAIATEIGGRPHTVDFGQLEDVRRLAHELLDAYPRIDVLANNAGGIYSRRQASADGHELTVQVNLLAPFLLTTLLIGRLTAASPAGARIVNTASAIYRRGQLDPDDLNTTTRRYNRMRVYAMTKLGLVSFSGELARRLGGTGVTVFSFHPGAVRTDIVRDSAIARRFAHRTVFDRVLTTPDEAAAPLLLLATSADPPVASGGYLHRLKPREIAGGPATDPTLARRLWDRLTEITSAPDVPEPSPPHSVPG